MKNTQHQQLGEIIDSKDTLIFRTHVADGSINGKHFDCSISKNGKEPVITYKDKYFVLPWVQIAELAEKAGLFRTTPKEIK